MNATRKLESEDSPPLSRRTVDVSLGERSYQIVIDVGLLDEAGRLIRIALGPEAHSVAIVSNRAVFGHYGPGLTGSLLKAGFQVVDHLIGDGERYKTVRTLEGILRFLAESQQDRQSAIVALGGGIVGDVAGFAAASYMRGVALVQVPTTLLAAIDSSIGGKTGVNLPEGKNLVGAFHQPRLVITDVSSFRTLPRREMRAALYEGLKYAVLGDPELLEFIRKDAGGEVRLEGDRLGRFVARCCRIKADVVAADEREAGQRRVLNLGHTFGHALETITHYRRFKHGEAVGYGIILATRLARELGLIDNGEADEIEAGALSIGRLPPIADLDDGAWLSAMRHDKKARQRQLIFVLPTRIGEVSIVSDVPDRIVRKTVKRLLRSRLW
jgi:3-dehydroquinate synthase